jgi:hypothetical protein
VKNSFGGSHTEHRWRCFNTFSNPTHLRFQFFAACGVDIMILVLTILEALFSIFFFFFRGFEMLSMTCTRAYQ